MAEKNSAPEGASQRAANLPLTGIIFVVAGIVLAALTVGFEEAAWQGVAAALIGSGAVIILRWQRAVRAAAAEAATPPAPTAGAAPQGAARAGASSLEGLLLRSDNVVQSLRDLVEHGQSQGDYGELPQLLDRVGLMGWEDAPKLGANKLKRNGRWWLYSSEELSERDYDRMVMLEGALNVWQDLSEGAPAPAGGGAALDARVGAVLSRVAELAPLSGTSDGRQEFLLSGADDAGEWACRLRFADAVENLPAPFRIPVEFQVNAAAGVLCADVEVPREACLAILAPENEAARVAAARAYALRLALALGHAALGACAPVTRVVVNCHHHGQGEAVLSADLTAQSLARLSPLMGADAGAAAALPEDEALRTGGADGSPAGVTPFAGRFDEALCPPERFREIELDPRPAGLALEKSCGAHAFSDLGLNEKAGRVSAWNALVGELGDTTQKAVGKLVELRDATGDLTVAEACERTSKALVEGALDVSNRHDLAQLFVDGGSLGEATGKARRILDADPSPEDLEGALGVLDQVLSPITQMGLYLDDQDTVFRYFNSVAERVHYNLTADDAGRRVRLVPDEYYGAHSMAARILNMLDRSDEAMTHADELVRVAPVTPDAALAKVRCLEQRSQVFEAADVLKRAIAYASTPRDMAICFYRLAFMEWKLGRSDLAVACYQRSIALHPEMAEQARSELQDLLEGDKSLSRLKDSEVVPALEAAGIPVGSVDELRAATRDAAAACADAGVFTVARPLTSVLLDLGRDDALIDVYRSFGPQDR